MEVGKWVWVPRSKGGASLAEVVLFREEQALCTWRESSSFGETVLTKWVNVDQLRAVR